MATTLQPAAAVSPTAQLAAVLNGAAVALLTDRAFLRVTGPDASRWLNGMVTNAIEQLQPGEGCYNFLLNAQGRILGDCTVYRDPEASSLAFVLETDRSQIEAIHQHLDKFIIMDDVELQPAPANVSGLLLFGPGAPNILRDYYRRFHGGDHADLPPLRLAFDSENGDQVMTPAAGLVPKFEIWISTAAVESLKQYALTAGAIEVSPEAVEHLRILEGTPRYGVDIRNSETARDLPQETAQTRALHFSKGCYLGQEIIERIRSRGSVHRTFSGFELNGTLPAPGAILNSDGKAIGELTSVSAVPLPEFSTSPAGQLIQLALGYVRREALDRGLALDYPGGTATSIALPYVIPEAVS